MQNGENEGKQQVKEKGKSEKRDKTPPEMAYESMRDFAHAQ